MTTSYATGAEFLARYDARLIGDLVRDDGSQEPTTSLPDHANLTAALEDAYGEIVSAITVGKRYTLDQLEPANLLEAAKSFLRRLNCDLALVMLKRRRGRFDPEKDGAFLKDCQERLKGLRSGDTILIGATDDAAKASVVSVAQPELIPVQQRQTIRFLTSNYYPAYPYTNPPGRRIGSGN